MPIIEPWGAILLRHRGCNNKFILLIAEMIHTYLQLLAPKEAIKLINKWNKKNSMDR